MKNDYERFVEELTQVILQKSHFPRKCLHFERHEGQGDRLYLECMDHERYKGICTLHTEELYLRYQNDAEFCLEDVVRDILDSAKRVTGDDLDQVSEAVSSYEKARENLFIRLLNYDRERRKLENMIYRRTGDIALVLYLRVKESEDCLTSARISRNVVQAWGRDEREVFRNALLNTYYLAPPRAYHWEKLLKDPCYEGENFMDILHPCRLSTDPCGNCISTKKKTNGAVSIFLPGVAQRIADLLQDDLYLAFTSIHEVMVHSVRTVELADLQSVLTSTIQESTPEQDFLTSHIYRYDRDRQCISCIGPGSEEEHENIG